MQSPLEQGLLMEALDQPDNFPQVFKKYQGLLSFPEKGLYACICSFVEETYLKSFLKDIVRILLSCGAESVFPVIYVKTVLFRPVLSHPGPSGKDPPVFGGAALSATVCNL